MKTLSLLILASSVLSGCEGNRSEPSLNTPDPATDHQPERSVPTGTTTTNTMNEAEMQRPGDPAQPTPTAAPMQAPQQDSPRANMEGTNTGAGTATDQGAAAADDQEAAKDSDELGMRQRRQAASAARARLEKRRAAEANDTQDTQGTPDMQGTQNTDTEGTGTQGTGTQGTGTPGTGTTP